MLVSALQNEFGDHIHILGSHAGLHLLMQAKWPITEEELVRRASKASIGVQPASNFWSCPLAGENRTVLLNYGGMLLEQIPIAIGLLSKAWLKK